MNTHVETTNAPDEDPAAGARVFACLWRRALRATLAAVLLAAGTLLLPANAGAVMAQGVPNACRNDAGVAVVPRASAGVGAWLLILNFNHAPSAAATAGCLVMTTAVNPQQVSRTLVPCQIANNVGGAQVGNGAAPFDGNFSVVCPGVNQGKQTLENFSIWGRAIFANAGATYPIVQHQDVAFNTSVSAGWNVLFNSRYGASTFASGDPVTNISGQVVNFLSNVAALTGSHSLNNAQLAPRTTIAPFEYHFAQPLTIGAPGLPWTLLEVIVDPPGNCCKS
jgi:hypothetical protein